MGISDIIEQSLNSCMALLPYKAPTPAQSNQIKIIAHRGAHDHNQGIIENTLAAFHRAIQLGCWGCELDIQVTKDKALVVHHDPDLQRLYRHEQRIKDLDLHTLKQLVPDIPTLSEVVAAVAPQQVLFIELKTIIPNESTLQTALQGLEAGKDYFLISLQEEILASLTQFPKHCQLLVSTQYNSASFCRLCIDKGYGGVMGHFLLLSQRCIAQLKAAGKLYGVGFVESKKSLYREIHRGIPWLFTNQAATISRHLKVLQSP